MQDAPTIAEAETPSLNAELGQAFSGLGILATDDASVSLDVSTPPADEATVPASDPEPMPEGFSTENTASADSEEYEDDNEDDDEDDDEPRSHLEELEEEVDAAHDEFIELKDAYENAHASASALKKRMEKQQEHLNKLIGEKKAAKRGGYTPRLPFGKTDDSPAEEPTAAAEVADEAWKQVGLDSLGITGKLAETLTEAGLSTLGKIADYTASGKQLTDIDGVGPAKAEKIEEACTEYWAANPRSSLAVAEAEPTAAEAVPEAEPVAEPDTEVEEITPTVRKSRKVTVVILVARLSGAWRASFDAKTKTSGCLNNLDEHSTPFATREGAVNAVVNNAARWLRENNSEAAAQDVEAWAEENFPQGPVQSALAICDHIKDMADGIPPAGAEFAASVLEKSESIRGFIEKHGEATIDQVAALKNMELGLEKWVP